MKRDLILLMLLSTFVAGSRGTCQAQRTVYTTNREHYAVWWLGSGPRQLIVSRETFWTDTKGHVVQCYGGSRGIQPGDKPHVFTRMYLGRASVRVPLPPWVVGSLAAGGVLLLGSAAIACQIRRRHLHPTGHDSQPAH
jgi:hypothetical protein